MEIINYNKQNEKDLIKRSQNDVNNIIPTVTEIINTVKEKQDQAIVE
jgi:histidinol dehydrogenase